MKIKIWVTKYALTTGVFTSHAEIYGTMATIRRGQYPEHFLGPDWHRNSGDAELQVTKMIDSKRKSIAKQLKKLDALEDAGMKVND